MNRLVLANLMRLKKNKMFWCGVILTVAFCIFACGAQFQAMVRYGFSACLDELLFVYMTLVGIFIAVICSLFVGTEYSDGTIRNKIISGRSRRRIYLSNFAACAAIGTALYLTSLVTICLGGIPLFGPPYAAPESLAWLLLDGLLVSVTYAAVFNMIVMLTSSKANSAVICILAAFLLLFAAAYIASELAEPEMMEQLVSMDSMDEMDWMTETVKNPRYLTGTKREIYQFFYDFLPSGQGAQLMDMNVAHPARLPLYSLAIIVASNMAGIFFFWRKDIK